MQRILRWLAQVLLICLMAGTAAAQDIDYALWDRTANRAVSAIEAGRASTQAFEALRTELADWRKRFSDAQNVNRTQIQTLEAQIAALAQPEDGEAPTEIGIRRAELNRQRTELQVPVLRAEEAYTQANTLIGQIDGLIRERTTDKLVELGPSPANPIHWGQVFSELQRTALSLINELIAAWNSDVQRQGAQENLPLIAGLILVGLLLLLRGRYWVDLLDKRITRIIAATPARWVISFVLSLGYVIAPYLGVVALIEAAFATTLPGIHADYVLHPVPWAVLTYLLARWVGLRLFPAGEARLPHLILTEGQSATARRIAGAIGATLGVYHWLSAVALSEQYSATTQAVLLGAVLVVLGLMTLKCGHIFLQHSAALSEEDRIGFRNAIIRFMGRAVVAVSVLGLGLVVIGYGDLAAVLLLGTAKSLILLAIITVLQRLVRVVYALIIGRSEELDDALIPVLIGFAITVAAVPFFALIWGARVATLQEYWKQFLDGISIGDTRVSPAIFISFALLFAAGYVVTRMLQGTLRNTLLPRTKMDVGTQNAIIAGTGYVGIFLAALIAITGAGIDLSSLAIVAGALSVGIGFGLQNIVSNFVSGVILLIERPISQGDWIEVNGVHGYVRDISVRSTRIETFDRSNVIIPNADLISGSVTNYTKGNLTGRVIVPVGVAYGSDTRKVEKILLEIAQAHPLVVLNPEPYVLMQGFGADSLDFEIRAILRDVNWVLNVKSDMNHEIARRFAEEGIEIPFAQRDLWLRNPEVLRGES